MYQVHIRVWGDESFYNDSPTLEGARKLLDKAIKGKLVDGQMGADIVRVFYFRLFGWNVRLSRCVYHVKG